jgi:hypothetical protein
MTVVSLTVIEPTLTPEPYIDAPRAEPFKTKAGIAGYGLFSLLIFTG